MANLAKTEPDFLADLLGDVPTTTELATTDEPSAFAPYVTFYSGREGQSGGSLTFADIKQAVPGISPGTPYVRDGDTIEALADPVIVLNDFWFSAVRNSSNEYVKASSDEKEHKPAVIAMLLVLRESPVLAIFDGCGKSRVAAFDKIRKEIAAEGNRMNVVATISGAQKSFTNDEGEKITYIKSFASCKSITADQAKVYADWKANQDPTAARELVEAFNERVAAVRALF